jgi:calcineurin-like phosphoesterase family protein
MLKFYGRIKHHFYKIFIGNRQIKFDSPTSGEIINGKRVWFISDMHFGHNNIIKWCRPEFRNLKDMHKRMIANWNFHVSRNDRVFCLGDFGDSRVLKKLNGKVTLVKGNHDKKQWNKQFVLKYRDMKFLVLHDPDDPKNDSSWFDGDWIIHGHTHVNSPFVNIKRNRVNVSVEVINYTPISMEEIYSILQESETYHGNRSVK